MYESEIEDQVDAGGNWERFPIVSAERVARGQGQSRLEAQGSRPAQRLPLLVHPAKVVTKNVIEETLSGLENCF